MCRNVRETGDLLRPAILKNLKIFSSEISDLPSTLVGYGGVNLNQVRSDANDVFITGRCLLRCGRRLRRRQRFRRLPGIGLGRRSRKGALQ